jgi:putative transposase
VIIVPRNNQYIIEVVYEIKDVDLKQDNNKYCAIDLGINNLATLTFNQKDVKPIIINGKPLKSINQY